MACVGVLELAAQHVVLVDDLIVPTGQDPPGVVRELHSSKTTVTRGEVLHVRQGVQVPKLRNAVAGGRDEQWAPHLQSIDGTPMALKHSHEISSAAVPNTDHVVLAAGDDVALIEADVQNAGRVMSETVYWLPSLDVPDDAGRIGRSGNHDLIVEAQAKNTLGVVLYGNVIQRVTSFSAVEVDALVDGARMAFERGLVGYRSNRLCSGSTNDLEAFVCVDVPDADRAVAAAGNDFVLIELGTIYAVCMALEVYGARRAVCPIALYHLSRRKLVLPHLRVTVEFSNACTAHW